MNTEAKHQDQVAMKPARSKGDSVKRMKLALAIGMSVAVLANQGCDRAEPIFSQNGFTPFFSSGNSSQTKWSGNKMPFAANSCLSSG